MTNLNDPLGLENIDTVQDIKAVAAELDVSLTTIEKMAKYFGGDIAAYAYLILVLLYFPCVATLGAIKQELGWRWVSFSAGWSLFLGYTLSVGFYQAMTYSQHPNTAAVWLIGITLSYIALWLVLKRIAQNLGPRKLLAKPF
ncbi:nucleoside recognition domain-containing protein [Thiosulfativibrio zosterae]|uniref:nucleoside recognition domain-containing protein n=1 Tax=Thiosulfativibrio zosterae TaxID=2675053 RepID=UPI0015666DB0|nr:nucleoside recognition domain-containing protein [Thiosulfativibrio zosterae]